MGANLLLRGGRVIDLAQNLDAVADVAIVDGRISAVGRDLAPPPDAQVLDVQGQIVSPVFLDIHVHAYGGLAFADPDTIGVNFGTSRLLGVPRDVWRPVAGDILLTAETVAAGTTGLFRVYWDGNALSAQPFPLGASSATVGQWEHTTFAAAGIVEIP